MLTEEDTRSGRGPQLENRRVRKPGEPLCHLAGSLGFYGVRISFWVAFAQSL